MAMKVNVLIFLVVLGVDVIPADGKEYIEIYKLGVCIAAIVLASFLLTLMGIAVMICRYKRKYLSFREDRLRYLGIQFDDEAEQQAKKEAEELELKAAKAAGKSIIYIANISICQYVEKISVSRK